MHIAERHFVHNIKVAYSQLTGGKHHKLQNGTQFIRSIHQFLHTSKKSTHVCVKTIVFSKKLGKDSILDQTCHAMMASVNFS